MTEAVLRSPAFDALAIELRQAKANRHDIEGLFPCLVAARTLEDADDPAAVQGSAAWVTELGSVPTDPARRPAPSTSGPVRALQPISSALKVDNPSL